MADAIWPASLPQELLVRPQRHTMPKGVVRTEMDSGPAYVRRRFTAAVVPITGSILVTREQLDTLWTFWTDTIQNGAVAFEWTDPRTANPAVMRIVTEPEVEPLAARADDASDRWRVSLSLEILPTPVSSTLVTAPSEDTSPSLIFETVATGDGGSSGTADEFIAVLPPEEDALDTAAETFSDVNELRDGTTSDEAIFTEDQSPPVGTSLTDFNSNLVPLGGEP